MRPQGLSCVLYSTWPVAGALSLKESRTVSLGVPLWGISVKDLALSLQQLRWLLWRSGLTPARAPKKEK